MSLWAEYQKERLGKHVLETDYGFAIYYFLPPTQCYLEDIYVVPEKRKTGLAKQLADSICEEAKKAGCKQLIGSVLCGAAGATNSLKILLAYGMQLVEVRGNLILFSKELGE